LSHRGFDRVLDNLDNRDALGVMMKGIQPDIECLGYAIHVVKRFGLPTSDNGPASLECRFGNATHRFWRPAAIRFAF